MPSGPFNQNCLQSRLVRLTAEAVRCLWSHQPLLVIQWCQSSDRQISDQSVLTKPELAPAELGGQVIEDMAFHLPLPRPSVYEDGEKPPSAYIATLGSCFGDLEASKPAFHGRRTFAPVLLRTVGIYWKELGILVDYTWIVEVHRVDRVRAVAA